MSLADKVAGLIKKKELKKRETVSFDSLDSRVMEWISEEEEKITAESVQYVEGISACIDELSQFLKRLREMEREEMFKKLDKIVRNSQKRFADSLKNVIPRVHVQANTYQALKKSHRDTQDALEQIQKLNKMHGRFLYYAFDREMKVFTKTVKEMAQYHLALGQLLLSKENTIAELMSIHERISDMEKMKEEIHHIEREKRNLQGNAETLEKEIKTFEKEISKLESSKEYERITKFKQHQEELSETLRSVEMEIYNVLHPLDRDFRKFKRQVELENVSFDLKLLDAYEKMTEQFLREETGYPNLKKIAAKMKEALEKQIIKEKGRKREKVMDILNSVLDDGLLTLQKEYHSVKEQLKTVPSDDIVQKIKTVKKGIEEKKEEISNLKRKEKNLMSKKENIKENIEDIEIEIIEKCSEVGITVE